MTIYVIAYGKYYSSGYYMDSVYRTTLKATRDHLHKLGYKYIKVSDLWENDSTNTWARIESFKEAPDAE